MKLPFRGTRSTDPDATEAGVSDTQQLTDTSPSGPQHRRVKRRLLARIFLGAVGLFAALAVMAVIGWQVQERSHVGRVASNTTVAGKKVSGQSSDALRNTLTSLATEMTASSVRIGQNQQAFSTPATAIGLQLDLESTRTAVLRFGHVEPASVRFWRWFTGLAVDHAAPVGVIIDDKKLAVAAGALDPGPRTEPVNATLAFEANRLIAKPGVDGHGIPPAEAAVAIRKAAKHGVPLVADVKPGAIPPTFNVDDMGTLVRDAERVTAEPLKVTIGGKPATIEPDVMRAWIRATAVDDRLVLDINGAATTAKLETLFPDAGKKPVDAGYIVVNDQPRIVEGKSGTVCCTEAAATAIRSSLTARLTNTAPSAAIDLPLRTVEHKVKAADIPDTGIRQPIGTFTTSHPAGQPRVTNIHLISDLIRGQVIAPGGTFSINNSVGPRTTEKGFVVDHVIIDGKFAESVGGGISQFATTLFNAAFFSGLDFGEYQAHSIYIDRYPYGREATVSFPHPDLQVKNTSPHGVLIWPTYTNTTLTVTLYSTPYATGEQTNQTTGPSGKCTRVRTERTRTYTDGRKAVDFVSALYQPAEGERC